MNSSNRPGSFTWGNGWRDDCRGQNQRFPLCAEDAVELIWGLGSALHVAVRWALCHFSCCAPGSWPPACLAPASSFLFFHYFQFCVFCQLESCFVSMAFCDPSGHIVLGIPTALAECATYTGLQEALPGIVSSRLSQLALGGATFAMDINRRG